MVYPAGKANVSGHNAIKGWWDNVWEALMAGEGKSQRTGLSNGDVVAFLVQGGTDIGAFVVTDVTSGGYKAVITIELIEKIKLD